MLAYARRLVLLKRHNALGLFARCNLTTSGESVQKTIEHFASFRPSPVNIKHLLDFGTKPSESDAFCFLRNEVAVRLSNMIKEMDHLPKLLAENRNLVTVRGWYIQTLKEIVQFHKANEKDLSVLRKFRESIPTIINRTSDVVPAIARGVMELRYGRGIDASTERQIHYFLDRLYMSKISVRLLLSQHVLLFSDRKDKEDQRHIGCIDPNCDINVSLHEAYEDAKLLCERNYGKSPKLQLEVYKMGVMVPNNTSVTLIYVPSNIHHILFELLKNAMRAEAEFGENVYQQKPSNGELPSIRAIICQGFHDITVRISDRGGGIPRSNIDKVFNYAFTSVKNPVVPGQEEAPDADHVPMAGYGYGLPLARLYARYFNGEISLSSIDGYGTDAYVFLRNVPTEASELLPAYTHSEATRAYDGSLPGDWLDASRAAASTHSNPLVKNGQKKV